MVPAMRILHTMLRVSDLEQSLAFYTGVLGMKLLRRKDYEGGRFTLAFVGYGDEESTAVLELTHNWDTKATHWAMPSVTSRSAPMTSMPAAIASGPRAAKSCASLAR